MSMVEKNKNLFVVTLDNGKQTYFNFADGNIYGVSGKVIQGFSAEAKKVLKSEQNHNFLAMYFCEKGLAYTSYTGIKHWSTSLVETIYSLYGNHYPPYTLCRLTEFCHRENFKLDKKGVKVLTQALSEMEDRNGELRSLDTYQLRDKITAILYNNFPDEIIALISHASELDMRNYIVEDAQKISFRYEHENWDYLDKDYYGRGYIYRCVYRYIRLCNLLHHERTYKNLFQSICMMEKEKALIADQLCVDYQKNAPLFFEDENFTILIPTTADEFKKEADYQQNCVFRLYYPKVKNCETHVVFVRKKSDIDTPYITCEVGNRGEIIQYLARFNKHVEDDDAQAFKVAYQRFLREHF